MPRKPRYTPKDLCYHVINRSAGRFPMFKFDRDFLAFYRIIAECHARTPLPILAFCIMNNHWHFVVKPTTNTQITDFFRWLANTHAMRFRVARNTVGHGHLYQGRFKTFPIQSAGALLKTIRYVERNPLTAKLVRKAENYRWSSLHLRTQGEDPSLLPADLLVPWPVPQPRNWLAQVNAAISDKDLAAIRASVATGRPFGEPDWVAATAKKLGLDHTLRPRGRPRKTQ